MALIKSISGIRGTIGGKPGENLTPVDIVNFVSAYVKVIKGDKKTCKVVIGRDGRISGPMVSQIVCNTLQLYGVDVIDLGVSTTPTVEVAVPGEKADGGIILTASHNPKQWNALKFLNNKGEFISKTQGETILELCESQAFDYVGVDDLGTYKFDEGWMGKHIQMILDLPLVKPKIVANKKYHVVVDCINSSGAISIPPLLDKLGCKYTLINEEITGEFAHNPEPLAKHLTQISAKILEVNADLGIVVDPDVDRLAFVNNDGKMFGEEYTLVAVADYILKNKKGNTVSNLSSTRALRDVTEKHGNQYFASAVGEVNVVEKMKEVKAVIGGEGNGGIIYPELHYGRDALVGIALFLSSLAEKGGTISDLKASFPSYQITKNKIQLTPEIDVSLLLSKLEKFYKNEEIDTVDGLKIAFGKDWVHMRKSNTEPIIRIYAESTTVEKANELAERIASKVNDFI